MKKFLSIPIVIIVFIGASIALSQSLDWQSPTAEPPGNNVAPPLNTGPLTQLKQGFLRFTKGIATGGYNTDDNSLVSTPTLFAGSPGSGTHISENQIESDTNAYLAKDNNSLASIGTTENLQAKLTIEQTGSGDVLQLRGEEISGDGLMWSQDSFRKVIDIAIDEAGEFLYTIEIDSIARNWIVKQDTENGNEIWREELSYTPTALTYNEGFVYIAGITHRSVVWWPLNEFLKQKQLLFPDDPLKVLPDNLNDILPLDVVENLPTLLLPTWHIEKRDGGTSQSLFHYEEKMRDHTGFSTFNYSDVQFIRGLSSTVRLIYPADIIVDGDSIYYSGSWGRTNLLGIGRAEHFSWEVVRKRNADSGIIEDEHKGDERRLCYDTMLGVFCSRIGSSGEVAGGISDVYISEDTLITLDFDGDVVGLNKNDFTETFRNPPVRGLDPMTLSVEHAFNSSLVGNEDNFYISGRSQLGRFNVLNGAQDYVIPLAGSGNKSRVIVEKDQYLYVTGGDFGTVNWVEKRSKEDGAVIWKSPSLASILTIAEHDGCLYIGGTGIEKRCPSDLPSTPTTNYLTVTSDGRTGLRTSNPQATLDVHGSIRQRGTTTLHADVAEDYLVVGSAEAGDIVQVSTTEDFAVEKTHGANSRAIGVISTSPGYRIESGQEGWQPVALAGRVPVKVLVNEDITPGDSIGLSDIPGVGKKAAEDERVIGYALESAEASNSIQSIIMFLPRSL